MGLEDIHVGRLLVLIQVIAIPVYFFILIFTGGYSTIFLLDSLIDITPEEKWILVDVVSPLLFALPWIIATIWRANRIADAYEYMGIALGKVRIDTKLFYGINAVYILGFIVLPALSPAITVLFFLFGLPYILGKKYKSNAMATLGFLIGFVLAIFPTILAISFYINYSLILDLLITSWNSNLNLLYGIGICLADAMVFGNFIYFIYEGAAQVDPYKEIPVMKIHLLKIVLFGVFLLIFLNTINDPTQPIYFINLIAIILGLFEAIVRKIKDLEKDDTGAGSYIMILLFMAVNFLRTYYVAAQTIVIVGAALIFIGLFILAYDYAGENPITD